MIATGWILLSLAGLLILVGAYPAAVFLRLAAGGVAIAAPTPDQRDARPRHLYEETQSENVADWWASRADAEVAAA